MVLIVGLHSCLLGLALLIVPIPFAEWAGFPVPGGVFFPSQTGIFLLAFGLVYLLALRDRVFAWAIVISKTLAVLFLVTHAALLDGPPILWAVAAGDFLMLLAVLVVPWAPRTGRGGS